MEKRFLRFFEDAGRNGFPRARDIEYNLFLLQKDRAFKRKHPLAYLHLRIFRIEVDGLAWLASLGGIFGRVCRSARQRKLSTRINVASALSTFARVRSR